MCQKSNDSEYETLAVRDNLCSCLWERIVINSTDCISFCFAMLWIPCCPFFRDPESDRGQSVRVNRRGRLHTQAELGRVAPLPLHYSCEASGRNVSASNGHSWGSVICNLWVSSCVVTFLQYQIAVHHHMMAQMPMCTLMASDLCYWICCHNWTTRSL